MTGPDLDLQVACVKREISMRVSVIDHYMAMDALRAERDDLQARVDGVWIGLEEMRQDVAQQIEETRRQMEADAARGKGE